MVDLSSLRAVIADIVVWRKDMTSSLLGDLNRVITLVETRGMPILMIDMPDACKLLDASLSSEYIDYSKLPSTIRTQKYGQYIPGLFKCLFDEIFRTSGGMLSSPDVNAIFFLRQLFLLYKKVDIPCPQLAVDKSIREFLQIESQMRQPTLNWHLDQLNVDDAAVNLFGDGNLDAPLFGIKSVNSRLISKLDYVSNWVTSQFPILDVNCIIPKHGPGAVADGKTGFDKYSFPFWPTKLSNVFDFETFGVANYGCLVDEIKPSSIEPAAKLIAVPKTLKGPRLIASEPTSHQFLQQGLLRWFRDYLPKPLRLSIDFTSQQLSRDAALLASRDDLIGTVDLSSASDRLSCWVVERFFRNRPDILSALHSVRTRTVSYSLDGASGRILLKKYANQGSAVTFPLQSIIYSCICVASLMFERGYPLSSKNIRRCFSEVRVFGDDLIVPASLGQSLDELMTYLGLKINWGKTHLKGKFRESCGIDAYDGVDITPVYMSSLTPSDDYSGLSSWIDVSNVAYSRGLWSLSDYMIKCIPEKYVHMIPICPRPLSCLYLRTTQKLTMTHNKTRWNHSTQSLECLSLTANVRKRTGGRVGAQDLLHYFISEDEDYCNPLPIDAFSISRKRSYGYRTRLKVRWVPLQAT